MSGILPNNGVDPSKTTNGLPTAQLTPGCDNLYYPGRCNPRLDPYAMNALISEFINALNSIGQVYDCTRLDNLANAFGILLSGQQNDDFFWNARVGIGSYYFVNTAIAGVAVPPQTSTGVSFIELTSGLTAAGQYNEGKLGTEIVSGSAPLVQATAIVTLAASPLVGQTIRLLNTESRIIRPSVSPGTIQADAFQAHRHYGSANTNVSGSGTDVASGSGWPRTVYGETGGTIVDGSNGTPRNANETRMKNLGVKAYMRIA